MEMRKKHGIIDLHTHILPEMDDGSQNAAMSVKMLKRLQEQGVKWVCATSHYYAHQERVEQFLQRRRQAVFALGDALGEAGVEEYPSIRLGAEVAYFPGISQCPELEQL